MIWLFDGIAESKMAFHPSGKLWDFLPETVKVAHSQNIQEYIQIQASLRELEQTQAVLQAKSNVYMQMINIILSIGATPLLPSIIPHTPVTQAAPCGEETHAKAGGDTDVNELFINVNSLGEVVRSDIPRLSSVSLVNWSEISKVMEGGDAQDACSRT